MPHFQRDLYVRYEMVVQDVEYMYKDCCKTEGPLRCVLESLCQTSWLPKSTRLASRYHENDMNMSPQS